MKIKMKCRTEDSSLVTLPAASPDEANKAAEAIAAQPHVMGCRYKGMSGTDKAIFSLVQKLEKGATYDVPTEVGESLVKLDYASAE